jgi:hypothetical protein
VTSDLTEEKVKLSGKGEKEGNEKQKIQAKSISQMS